MLRQAIRVDPDQADYFVCLGTAYAHAEQHDFALAACEMALQLAPEHAVAAENRRHALKALGLPETTLIDRT
jgi:lipoprotein NlpI